MTLKTLEMVVLNRDLPESGLCSGDLGTIVQSYEPGGLEVEFVTASGRTQAVVTLNKHDVRAVRDEDLMAIRSLAPGSRLKTNHT